MCHRNAWEFPASGGGPDFPAEPVEGQAEPFGTKFWLNEKIIENARTRANHRFWHRAMETRQEPSDGEKFPPLLTRRTQAVRAQYGSEQCRLAEIVILVAVEIPSKTIVQCRAWNSAKCPVQTSRHRIGGPGVAAVRLWHSGVSNAHGKTLQWKTENASFRLWNAAGSGIRNACDVGRSDVVGAHLIR